MVTIVLQFAFHQLCPELFHSGVVILCRLLSFLPRRQRRWYDLGNNGLLLPWFVCPWLASWWLVAIFITWAFQSCCHLEIYKLANLNKAIHSWNFRSITNMRQANPIYIKFTGFSWFIHVILPSHTIPTIRVVDVSDPALIDSSIQSFMQLPIFTRSSLLLQRGDLHSSTHKSGSRYIISM